MRDLIEKYANEYKFSDIQDIKILLTFLKAKANNEDSSKLEVACTNRDLLDENKHMLTQRALDLLTFLTVDIYNKSINFLTDALGISLIYSIFLKFSKVFISMI